MPSHSILGYSAEGDAKLGLIQMLLWDSEGELGEVQQALTRTDGFDEMFYPFGRIVCPGERQVNVLGDAHVKVLPLAAWVLRVQKLISGDKKLAKRTWNVTPQIFSQMPRHKVPKFYNWIRYRILIVVM